MTVTSTHTLTQAVALKGNAALERKHTDLLLEICSQVCAARNFCRDMRLQVFSKPKDVS